MKFCIKFLTIALFSSSTLLLSSAKADLADDFKTSQCEKYYYVTGGVISCVSQNGWVWETPNNFQNKKLGGLGITTNINGTLRTFRANQDQTLLIEYSCKTNYGGSTDSSACQSQIIKRIHEYTGYDYDSAFWHRLRLQNKTRAKRKAEEAKRRAARDMERIDQREEMR